MRFKIGLWLGRAINNAVAALPNWILATGFWNDSGLWDDTNNWKDS